MSKKQQEALASSWFLAPDGTVQVVGYSPSRMERVKPYVEYVARALAATVSRLVEWTLLLALAALLLAAARWLWLA